MVYVHPFTCTILLSLLTTPHLISSPSHGDVTNAASSIGRAPSRSLRTKNSCSSRHDATASSGTSDKSTPYSWHVRSMSRRWTHVGMNSELANCPIAREIVSRGRASSMWTAVGEASVRPSSFSSRTDELYHIASGK